MKVMNSIRRAVCKWLLKDYLADIRNAVPPVVTAATEAAVTSLGEQLRVQIAALQALDVDFHETGKIVLIARVGKKDICKIFDVKPEFSMHDYIRLSEEFEARFGARVGRVDLPAGMVYPRRLTAAGSR